MSRRIEIELTSARPDGSWTWRAAGAREPKGVLDGGLLYEGAKAGDVLRAEADFEIDGIVIISVAAPKERHREEPQRIEVLGPPRGDVPGVTTSLVGRSGGRRDGERGPRRDGGDRGPRRDGERGARRDGGDRPPRRDGADRPPRRDGDAGRPRRDSGAATGREGRPEGGGREARRGGPDEGRRTDAARREGPRRDGPGREGPGREGPGREGPGRSDRRRLNPGHAHRQAVMASLRPEEQAVAEQVLRGGIPAVRTALHLERERATAEGRPAPDTDGLVALAEQLLPRLKAAEWRDRAEAAVKAGDDIALRDLRSVVAGADSARDEESRALAEQLRAALERRVEAQRTEWVTDIGRHLDQNRIVKALQLSGRPPDPSTRVPADLATRVAEVAGAAMTADISPERWLALLEAAASSPMRRSVKPAGFPAEPGPDLLRAAHQQSGRVPALAAMLGVSMPPPPGRRPPRPPQPGAPGRPRPPAAASAPAADGPGAPTGTPDTEATPNDHDDTPAAADSAPTTEPAPEVPPGSDAAPAPEAAEPTADTGEAAPDLAEPAAPAPGGDLGS